MMMNPVISSSVVSVGFDLATSDLEIVYKNGNSYLYADVSETVYENLMVADSIGKFVNDEIKPKYAYSKI